MKNAKTINRVLLLALCALTSLKAAEIRQDSVGAGAGYAKQSFVSKMTPLLMVSAARNGEIEKLKELRVTPPVKVFNKHYEIIDAPAVLEGEQINPLMAAAKAGQTEVVKWLLDQGALLWKDKAIDAATAAGHSSIAQLIQQSIEEEFGDEDEGDWKEFEADDVPAPNLHELARSGNIPNLLAGISKAFPRATPDEQKKIMVGLLSQVRSEPAKAVAPSASASTQSRFVLPGSAQQSTDVGAGAGHAAVSAPLAIGVISQAALDQMNKSQKEALLIAYCMADNVEGVAFLVGKNKVSIETKDSRGMTPWLIAAERNNLNLAHLCVAYKANVLAKNNRGEDASEISKTNSCHLDFQAYQNLRITFNNYKTAFKEPKNRLVALAELRQNQEKLCHVLKVWIMFNQDSSMLDEMMGKQKDELINKIFDDGYTFLIRAATSGNNSIVAWLLAHNADASIVSPVDNITALERAEYYYHDSTAALLRAHLKRKTGSGKTEENKQSAPKKNKKKKKEKSAEQIAQEQQERQAQQEQERKEREQKEQKEREAQEKERQRKAQSERDKARAKQEREEKEKAAAAEREKQEKNRLEKEKRRAEKAQKEAEQARLAQQEKEKKEREAKEQREAEDKRERERIHAIEQAALKEKQKAKAENQILSQITQDVETAQGLVAMAEEFATKTLSKADEYALYISNFEQFSRKIGVFINKAKTHDISAKRLARFQDLQGKLATAQSRVDVLLTSAKEKQKQLNEREAAQAKERARRERALASRQARKNTQQPEQRSVSAPTVQAAQINPAPAQSGSVTISPPVLGGLTIEQQLAQEMADLAIKQQRIAQLQALAKPAISRSTHAVDEKASSMAREFNRKEEEQERAHLARSQRASEAQRTPLVATPVPAPASEDEVDAAPLPAVSASRPAQQVAQPVIVATPSHSAVPGYMAHVGAGYSQPYSAALPVDPAARVPTLQEYPYTPVSMSASMPAVRSQSAMPPGSAARPAAPRPLSEPVVLSESDLVRQMRQHKSWLDKDLERIKEQVRAESEQPHYLEEVGITSDMDDLALSMLKSLDEC